ncbi:UNKNOWN [Stylonychia lemnae]|uniref:Uncharacterized protein n=1 Tax=Stylonychia lemnae TaxID=5949 RepID=A0A077ZXI0_STYLE|nr:UNKNOWN [Stylonychia lemnae]|eukprot:CDW74266.1 UNKNOWN [Stylonychia lemnae]
MHINPKPSKAKVPHLISKYLTNKKASLDESTLITSGEKQLKSDGIKLQPLTMKIKFKIESPEWKKYSRIMDSQQSQQQTLGRLTPSSKLLGEADFQYNYKQSQGKVIGDNSTVYDDPNNQEEEYMPFDQFSQIVHETEQLIQKNTDQFNPYSLLDLSQESISSKENILQVQSPIYEEVQPIRNNQSFNQKANEVYQDYLKNIKTDQVDLTRQRNFNSFSNNNSQYRKLSQVTQESVNLSPMNQGHSQAHALQKVNSFHNINITFENQVSLTKPAQSLLIPIKEKNSPIVNLAATKPQVNMKKNLRLIQQEKSRLEVVQKMQKMYDKIKKNVDSHRSTNQGIELRNDSYEQLNLKFNFSQSPKSIQLYNSALKPFNQDQQTQINYYQDKPQDDDQHSQYQFQNQKIAKVIRNQNYQRFKSQYDHYIDQQPLVLPKIDQNSRIQSTNDAIQHSKIRGKKSKQDNLLRASIVTDQDSFRIHNFMSMNNDNLNVQQSKKQVKPIELPIDTYNGSKTQVNPTYINSPYQPNSLSPIRSLKKLQAYQGGNPATQAKKQNNQKVLQVDYDQTLSILINNPTAAFPNKLPTKFITKPLKLHPQHGHQISINKNKSKQSSQKLPRKDTSQKLIQLNGQREEVSPKSTSNHEKHLITIISSEALTKFHQERQVEVVKIPIATRVPQEGTSILDNINRKSGLSSQIQ